MEIGLDPDIPTYSGGLGILAGDTLRSFADLGVPAVAVTLLSEFGYFRQEIQEDETQAERYERWDIEKHLKPLGEEVIVHVNHSQVHVKLWQYELRGEGDHVVPIIYLDTNHPHNTNEHRKLTQRLYPTNKVFRMEQEIVLGIGGVLALYKLGYFPSVYHLNEGHPAFLILELLRQLMDTNVSDPFATVRDLTVFTTHTPVPAGHDKYPRAMAEEKLGKYYDILKRMPEAFGDDDQLNMSFLAAFMSDKINGVAKRHAEVSRELFPNYPINSITNGIHHTFWCSSTFAQLFDEKVPGWRIDPSMLLHVLRISKERIAAAHDENKQKLIEYVNEHCETEFNQETFTIGYARRITKYKRPDLLFYDLEKLKKICEDRPIQIVFAGKAHYEDTVGKSLIHEILTLSEKLPENIKVAYIPNYDISEAKIIIPGVDLWLNTPMRPLEASGTSGMKASLNGVPNFSVLDGWWIEGAVEDVTGWTIGPYPESADEIDPTCIDSDDSDSLYKTLEEKILPMYYENRDAFNQIRKTAIALHGSHFNTHRMVQQYVVKSYLD